MTSAAAPEGRRLRIGLGPRLAVAFLAAIALAVGSAALVARWAGGADFRSYVAARGGGLGPGPGSAGSAGAGPGAGMGTGMGPGMMAGGRGAAMMAPPEEWFLARLDRALWLSAGVGGAAALAVSLLVTRRLTRPVRLLQGAARRMAAGDLAGRVDIRTGDELEELGLAFNHMAASLQQQEAARRALVADVAHDLRTPLAVIQGTVDAMLDGVYAPEAAHLRSIREETERLGRLVADLRGLSLADTGQLHLNIGPVAPADLLERAANRARRRAADHAVAVRVDVADDLPALLIDRTRIDQVLDNLLDNALRYTPDGGEIVLRAAPAAGAAPSLTLTRQGKDGSVPSAARIEGPGMVALVVGDSGPGIAPEHLPHVFERFYRADLARGRGAGSGLGLAIVRGLVEAHGGRVWAQSEAGAGARLWLTLPAAPSPQSLHNPGTAAPQTNAIVGVPANPPAAAP